MDVKAFAEKAKGLMREAVGETLQDLAETVVVRTPYEFGLLRGSWYLRLDAPDAGPEGGEDKSPQGAVTVARLTVDLLKTGLPLGPTFYLLNNARYARRLEYGFVGTDALGRSYNQRPRSFVRGTLAEADAIAQAAAARVAAGKGGGAKPGGGGARGNTLDADGAVVTGGYVE